MPNNAMKSSSPSRSLTSLHIDNLPIRVKLIGSYFLTMLMIVTFVMFYYPARERQLLIEDTRERDRVAAELISLGVGMGLDLADYEMVAAAMNWARRDSTLVYVIVYDADGHRFAEYNPRLLPSQSRPIVIRDAIIEIAGISISHLSLPISYRGKTMGTLVYGSSLERLDATIASNRIHALIVSLSILTVGLLVAWVFVNKITKPLRHLTATARQVAAGDMKVNLPIYTTDEIGQLGCAFTEMVSHLRDGIKAIESSESKFRSLTELLPEAVFEVDVHWRLTFFNRKAVEYFGLIDPDTEARRSICDLVVKEQREVLASWLQQLVDTCEAESREFRGMRQDNAKVFPITVHCAPIMTSEIATGLRGVIVDVSEQRHLERELVRSQNLDSIGLLAGGIAHDFNNLLAGILGRVSMAAEKLGKEHPISAELLTAEQAILRATDLTQQLLTFARGGNPIKKAADMESLIRESVQLLVQGSNVRADISCEENLHNADVDASQIHQVLNNLVLNAIQAMPEGGIITITVGNRTLASNNRYELPAGNYLRIELSDNGCGIAEEHLQSIFEPYFTTKETGTGLGLASVYSIVRKHVGHIEVSSRVGQGTTVEVILPASVRETSMPAAHELSDSARTGKILVMDDEADLRELAEAVLTSVGHSVICVPDGESAVRVYRHAQDSGKPFQGVVLDLTIPGGMGGREALARIKDCNEKVAAIACSGYANNPVMSDYTSFGFQGVVPKPYRPNELRAAVERLLAVDLVVTP